MTSSQAPASYFTDGVNLFRLEEYLGEDGVLLEDVATERIWWTPHDELKTMGLRPVRPLQKGVVVGSHGG